MWFNTLDNFFMNKNKINIKYNIRAVAYPGAGTICQYNSPSPGGILFIIDFNIS